MAAVTMTFRDAIRIALTEEMERDPSVVLLGEDIGLGGVFNVTPGLLDRFGPDRVIDTPISEMAFTSAAFGAALRGLRPVVEIMFADFLGLVLDTLTNQAARHRFISNGRSRVPLVVRTSVGAGVRFGAIHSDTPTAWVIGTPGLTVAAPSNAGDAKALTHAAIRHDGPVVVFEHKLLYGKKGEVPDPLDAVAPGTARVTRVGEDITLIAAMAMVPVAERAADALAADGISAGVVDLRWLRPLDRETIIRSVSRTRRVVCVEEGPATGGYAAAVLALVAEHVPGASARRVGTPEIPVPFSPPLEDSVLPSAARVEAAARSLLDEPAASPQARV